MHAHKEEVIPITFRLPMCRPALRRASACFDAKLGILVHESEMSNFDTEHFPTSPDGLTARLRLWRGSRP